MSRSRFFHVPWALLVALSTLPFACHAPKPKAPLDQVIVESTSIAETASHAQLTVVTFFSSHCPCQTAHDERLKALATDYGPRGVQFVAIDAEADASRERAGREREARHYPYPLLVDPSGASADALGAQYATYTVVLDREGKVRYAGGIDSDRTHLTPDAQTFVRDALDDALAGKDVRTPRGKVLGCALSR